MAQRAGVILQFLAAAPVAVRQIGVIVQENEAGHLAAEHHADDHQRVAVPCRRALPARPMRGA